MAPKFDFAIQDINTKFIVVDPMGQRDVERRRAQFNKIMRNFDENLVQPISVALIDGKYYCFDGQMTMKVLKARNRDRDLCVKCRVYNGLTKLDAANLFINQRGITSKVTLLDKIRVKANYGDEKANDFIKVTEANGLTISWTGSKCKNAIIAASTLWNEFTMFNDNELYGKFIRCIKAAWDGDPDSTQQKMLKGVGLFFRTYKDQINEETFKEKLSKKTPNDIIRDASADRTNGARKYAIQILLAYNFGQREASRLPILL